MLLHSRLRTHVLFTTTALHMAGVAGLTRAFRPWAVPVAVTGDAPTLCVGRTCRFSSCPCTQAAAEDAHLCGSQPLHFHMAGVAGLTRTYRPRAVPVAVTGDAPTLCVGRTCRFSSCPCTQAAAEDAHLCGSQPLHFHMAGVAGFEPANAWIKTKCLAAWRHPNKSVRSGRCL